MSNAFTSIAQGLQEAIVLSAGKPVAAQAQRLEEIDVAALRRSLGLTPAEFAAMLRISLGTLRHWERGDRKPQGPALSLLRVVAKEPQAVLRALA